MDHSPHAVQEGDIDEPTVQAALKSAFHHHRTVYGGRARLFLQRVNLPAFGIPAEFQEDIGAAVSSMDQDAPRETT